MDKETDTHTHTHTHRVEYSVIKKKEILPFATTWMNHEGIMLSEISQMGKAYTVTCYLEKHEKKTELREQIGDCQR